MNGKQRVRQLKDRDLRDGSGRRQWGGTYWRERGGRDLRRSARGRMRLRGRN